MGFTKEKMTEVSKQQIEKWNEDNEDKGVRVIRIRGLLTWRILGAIGILLLIANSVVFFYALFNGNLKGLIQSNFDSTTNNEYKFSPESTNQYQNDFENNFEFDIDISNEVKEAIKDICNSS